ncbi:MAG: glucose 1-dehydrogenase [Fimbriimonadaceae bacterium]|nr:glucose 1-dehydrogenase [Fimbriimonadaceae bacterium]
MLLPAYNLDRQKELVASYPHRPLAGQVALVTGANSGIGEGCARHLAAAGADVVVNYVVNPEAAQAVVDDIVGAGGRASSVAADVSQEAEVVAMVQEVVRTYGTLDILVANAGLQRDAKLTEMTVAQWDKVMDVNFKGQFLCVREAVKEFDRRGMRPVSKALGKIVCMSSVHEFIPWAGHVNYAASKGGIKLMMQSVAQEVSGRRIRVNSIAPGAIATPINRPAWETTEAEAKLLGLIPYDRVGVPDDIGQACVWLASDASDYVVGTTLTVDGGMCLMEGFATGG